MSTPPDFFTSDNNDPRREQQSGPERRDPAGPAEEEQQRQAPPTDTGPQHRVPPAPAGERRPTPPAPQPPQPPRWQAPTPYGAVPSQSGPIPSSQAPQAPTQYGSVPSQAAPWPQQPTRQPERPPASEPHNNNSSIGQHHRPRDQGYTAPPAQPDQPEVATPPAATRPVRRPDEDFGERTSIISADDVAKARELGEFFNEPADTSRPLHTPAPDPQALFNGPTGGEPFIPSGYVSGSAPDQIAAPTRRVDLTGWRKAVAVMTFGLIKPGPSAKQVAAEELIRRIRASLVDVFVVGFVNSKGGVGKTTMAVAAGNAIARERGDRVIVVDVDTDLGNLSSRFHEHGGANANIEAFSALPNAGSYSKVRVFTVQNDDRLEMLSSQNDPRSSYRLTSTDFDSTMKILRSHYNVVLLDCGTSITSPLFSTIANQVDCLVVVASQDAPGLNGAYRTQKWLGAHGLSRLLPRTVVVLNRTGSHKPKVNVTEAATVFREEGTEEIVTVPFDDHLDEGGAVEFDRMSKKTRKAVMEVAGAIARYYPSRQSHRTEGMGGY